MPIDAALWVAFVAAAALIVMSPGPDTLLILRNTLISGTGTGLATVLGVQLGLVVHTIAAILGLSVAIASSLWMFRTIALAGAVYLGWLGLQSIRRGALPMADLGASPGRRTSPWLGCRDAILTNLLNPKVILLYVALMPNFVRVERGDVPRQLIFLGITLIGVNILWQSALWAIAGQVRAWLARPTVMRGISWTTGLFFFLFALAMIFEHVT